MSKTNKYFIVSIVVLACAVMGLVDAVIMPSYLIKSAIKISLFLLLPFAYFVFSKDLEIKKHLIPTKKGFLYSILTGFLVFSIIIGAFFLFRNVFDFSNIASSLIGNAGVNPSNFVWVSLYISFVNSFLEELFFRGFAFAILKNQSGRCFSYIFSSLAFSLYHISMMIGWFDWYVLLLAIFGLAIGGMIFNFFNEKTESIYMSWLIHMFANFAINTIGFILFGII